jgi:hypothetical protein
MILYYKIEPSFQQKGWIERINQVLTLGELFSNFLKLKKKTKNGGKYFLKFIITIFFMFL